MNRAGRAESDDVGHADLRIRDQPVLGSPDGGRPEATQALKIAGLNWSLPPFSA